MPSATCPKCCRPVTLPLEATPAAWVRCPLCQEEYRLQQAIEFTPPSLIVLSERAPQPSLSSENPVAVAAESVRGTRERDQSIPDLLIDPNAAVMSRSETAKWSPSANRVAETPMHQEFRSPVSPANRKSKRPKNPLAEFAKIAIAGCVGLAIGCGVLMWVFKVDLFKLAHRLPAFMVPEQMRSADTNDTTPTDGTSETKSAMPPPVAQNSPPSRPADPFANYQPPGREPEKTTALSPLKTVPETSQRSIVSGPKSGPSYSVSEASEALAVINDAASRLAEAEKNQTDDAEIDESRRRFFTSLSTLAETVTLLRSEPADQQAIRSAAGEVLRNLFGNQEQLQSLGIRAAAEFANPMRASNGIVLAGVVEEVRSLDDQFRTFVRLPGKDSPISVITAQKPPISSGDTAIAAGVVVDDPNQNIAGYEGADERIVWAGLIVKSGVALAKSLP
jgi:hypothetical protein